MLQTHWNHLHTHLKARGGAGDSWGHLFKRSILVCFHGEWAPSVHVRGFPHLSGPSAAPHLHSQGQHQPHAIMCDTWKEVGARLLRPQMKQLHLHEAGRTREQKRHCFQTRMSLFDGRTLGTCQVYLAPDWKKIRSAGSAGGRRRFRLSSRSPQEMFRRAILVGQSSAIDNHLGSLFNSKADHTEAPLWTARRLISSFYYIPECSS